MHTQNRTLKVSVIFPDHGKRTESPEHLEVRKRLIVEGKFPCYICGRNIDDFAVAAMQADKTLTKTAALKLAAESLEIHHLFAEYSEGLDIDIDRVQADHPVFANYNTDGKYDDIDSLPGSLVICALHHRGSTKPGRAEEEGIHASDFPTWLMQKYIKDEDLDQYIPGVVVIRKGVSDEHGYLPAWLTNHLNKQPVRAVPKPEKKAKKKI